MKLVSLLVFLAVAASPVYTWTYNLASCAGISCAMKTTCRVVEDKTRGITGPQCLSDDQVPADAGMDVCGTSGYPMLSYTKRNKKLTYIVYIAGKNRCPSGTVKISRKCCHDLTKPGFCLAEGDRGYGTGSNTTCKRDNECGDDEKCCYYNRRNVCMARYTCKTRKCGPEYKCVEAPDGYPKCVLADKPGECPALAADCTPDAECKSNCNVDGNCPGSQKCCATCGGTCKACSNTTEPATCADLAKDSPCAEGESCQMMDVKSSKAPFVQIPRCVKTNPGRCSTYTRCSYRQLYGQCRDNCVTDEDCPNGEKCCMSCGCRSCKCGYSSPCTRGLVCELYQSSYSSYQYQRCVAPPPREGQCPMAGYDIAVTAECGATCRYDVDCTENSEMKCCAQQGCSGNRCIMPRVSCNNTACAEGLVCRVIVDKKNRTVVSCEDPEDFPENADKTKCGTSGLPVLRLVRNNKQTDFRKLVLFKKEENDTCTRPGLVESRSGLFCCHDTEKEGVCPMASSLDPCDSSRACEGDNQCPDKQKCCMRSDGSRQCLEPVTCANKKCPSNMKCEEDSEGNPKCILSEKLGVCPTLDAEDCAGAASCNDTCQKDGDCPSSTYKCCDQCGGCKKCVYVRTASCYYAKCPTGTLCRYLPISCTKDKCPTAIACAVNNMGTCPYSYCGSYTRTKCRSEQCSNDGECGAGEKCCYSCTDGCYSCRKPRCGYVTCQANEECIKDPAFTRYTRYKCISRDPSPGMCPVTQTNMKGKECSSTCSMDGACKAGEKCCARDGCDKGNVCVKAQMKPTSCSDMTCADGETCYENILNTKTDLIEAMCSKTAPPTATGSCTRGNPLMAADLYGRLVQAYCDSRVDKVNCPVGFECKSGICCMAKSGMCPKVAADSTGSCDNACADDDACSGGKKCCSNGCGTACVMPEASTTCDMNFAGCENANATCVMKSVDCGSSTPCFRQPTCSDNKCIQPITTGYFSNYNKYYYFDVSKRECVKYAYRQYSLYNRFSSLSKCKRACMQTVTCPDTAASDANCSALPDCCDNKPCRGTAKMCCKTPCGRKCVDADVD